MTQVAVLTFVSLIHMRYKNTRGELSNQIGLKIGTNTNSTKAGIMT